LQNDPKQKNSPQLDLISAVRSNCEQDEHLVAALMYGSFIRGEGDAYSDIEFVLYFQDDLATVVDQRVWLEQVAPLELLVPDGKGNWVVIFENLVRGEFHFEPASKMSEIPSWKLYDWGPSIEAMLVIDRTGELTQHLACLVGPAPRRGTPDYVLELSGQFFNQILFGTNVLKRGERARALDHLSHLHRILQWLARLVENKMEHFPSPAKSFEADISPEAYQRFQRCTATLAPGSLEQAYTNSWQWGKALVTALSEMHDLDLPVSLIEKIDRRMADWFSDYSEEE
jgi:lincosamide nucleotidyltransferase B/F